MNNNRRIEELYNRYGAMVYRRCFALLKNEAEAYDCTQDVFLKVIKKINVIRDESNSSLLYTMASNLCLNRIRDKAKQKMLENEDLISHIASYEDLYDKIETKLKLERILNIQKKSTRLIALLHFYDGYTLQEVAQKVNMSLSGVRKRIRTLQNSVKQLEK